MGLFIAAIVLILALVVNRFSMKSGMPSLLLFMALGMAFRFLGLSFDDFSLAEQISSISLVFVMFYGGFGTNWKMAKPVAKQSIILASLGVVLTALITGFFCRFVLKFTFLEAMLLGSIVGSTDYAAVSNILRSKNLNLRYNTAPLLELESGSNDPAAYTMTIIFMTLILGEKISIAEVILKQVIFGLALGFFMSFVFIKAVKILKFYEEGMFSIFVIAWTLLTYALTILIKGNGYLAVYILGIIIGNQQFHGKREVVFFFDGLTSLIQVFLFFLLGLIADPKGLVSCLPIAFVIAIFMMFIARPLTIYILMAHFKLKKDQLKMISLAGIKGAAAIAFAMMVINSNLNIERDIYHTVFGICLFSTLIQGYLMPIMSKKWKMIDPNDNVLKTFNDYQDKSDIGFIKTTIGKNSRWIGKKVSELNLAFEVIVAKIERKGKTIVPRGDTIIKEGDIIVLGGESYFDSSGKNVLEFTITQEHPWANKEVMDLKLPDNQLIIMVQRGYNDILVPVGSTKILPDDKIILIEA